MGKRKNSNDEKLKQKRLCKQGGSFLNEYNGYIPLSIDTQLEVIDIQATKSKEFYRNYIKARKPVLINGILPEIDISKFSPEKIVDTLDSNDLLLVEKKFKGGFGSGTERIKKTFGEFMDLLQSKDGDDYYLTTQYAEDDPDDINECLKDEDEDQDEENIGNKDIEIINNKFQLQSDEEGEGDDQEGDNGLVPLVNSITDFSDNDSIDFNDIHDDFDELLGEDENNEELDENEIITRDIKGEPLTITESIRRAHELVQKPLTNLLKAKSLPIEPKLMKKLIPQQINAWIGSSKLHNDKEFKFNFDQEDLGLGRMLFGGGSSSGLHHDHADNLYIPLKGSKRFTIFAPSDAEKMYTVGEINHIHKSGVIDYKNNDHAPGWRSLRSDSAIITEVAKWRLDENKNLSELERETLIKLIEDEEEVLKGFETKVFDSNKVKKDPPSFSTIPASIVHLNQISNSKIRSKLLEFAKSKWPKFFEAKRITVSLKPGQMLYLPAGWFHEVTSFGDSNKSKTHIALNYWYSPPSGDSENVYSDNYWKDDYERTLESVKYFQTN